MKKFAYVNGKLRVQSPLAKRPEYQRTNFFKRFQSPPARQQSPRNLSKNDMSLNQKSIIQQSNLNNKQSNYQLSNSSKMKIKLQSNNRQGSAGIKMQDESIIKLSTHQIQQKINLINKIKENSPSPNRVLINEIEQIIKKISHKTETNQMPIRFNNLMEGTQDIQQIKRQTSPRVIKFKTQLDHIQVDKQQNDEMQYKQRPDKPYINQSGQLNFNRPTSSALSQLTLKTENNDIEKLYSIKDTIGTGSYAIVKLAIDRKTKKKYAIKIYEKINLQDVEKMRNVKREIFILEQLDHNNIIKLYRTIDNKTAIYLVLEFGGSQSLYHHLKAKLDRRFQEPEARQIFEQVVQSILYCHNNQIVHRDIKLENILYDDDKVVKLIDFGFSIQVPNDKKLNKFCGTPTYMAPEIILKKEYSGCKVDVWALGVLLFVLLTGNFPFRAKEEKELYQKILNGVFDTPFFVSPGAKGLITKMLRFNPTERILCQDILKNNWMLAK